MIHVDRNHIDMDGDIAEILTELSVGIVKVSEVLTDAFSQSVEESAAWVMSKVTEGVKAGITQLKK